MSRQRPQGFTLIEMTVVIALISVVVVFGLDISKNALRSGERVSVQEKLNVVQQALESYVDRNGYLPCPANPALLPASTSFGVESRTGANCSIVGGIYNGAGTVIGAVPVRALGLNDSFASDPWNNKLLYGVSANMVTSIRSYIENAPALQVSGGVYTGTNYPLTTNTAGTAAAYASYAVLSFGPGGHGAYPTNGTSIALACDTTRNDRANCENDQLFYSAAYNDGGQAAYRFDDYIVWGSNLLKRNPLAVLPNACPTGCELWCAPCTTNAGAAAGAGSPPASASRLCHKFITATTPACEATCIWRGVTATATNAPCP